MGKLVTSLSFLDQKLRRFGLDLLLDDVDNCLGLASGADADGYSALADALRLARPALAADASELPVQIAGRLLKANSRAIATLTAEAKAVCQSGLLPLTPALTQGDEPITDVIVTEGSLEALAVTPDGTHAVTATSDGSVSVWSLPLRGNSRLQKFRVPDVQDICLTTDSRFILTGDGKGRVAMWDRRTGFREQICESGGDFVRQLTPAGPGHVLALLRNSEVCVVELASFTPVRRFHLEVAESLCGLSNDRVLVGTADGFIDLIDPQNGRRTEVLGWHGGFKRRRMSELELFTRSLTTMPMLGVLSGPDDLRKMDFAAFSEKLDIPEKQKRALLESMKQDPHRHAVTCLAADAGGAPLALSGCFNGEAALLDLAENRVVRRFQHTKNSAVRCCALSARHGLAVVGSYDGSIRLWDVNSGAEIGALTSRGANPVSLQFIPGSSSLLAGFEDGRLQVWHDPAGAAAEAPRELPSAVRAIATLDGQVWTVTSTSIRGWEAATQAEIRQMDFTDRGSANVTLTPDRRRILSISDRTIILTDVTSGWVVGTVTIEPTTIGPTEASSLATLKSASATSDLELFVVFSYAEILTATVGNYSRLELRDKSGALLRVLDERAGIISGIEISLDGRWAVTLGTKVAQDRIGESTPRHQVRLWDLAEGRCVKSYGDADVTALTFSTDSTYVLLKTRTDVRRWQIGDYTEPQPGAGIPTQWSDFTVVDQLAIGTVGNTVEVWDIATAERTGALTLDTAVTAFAVVNTTIVVGDALGGIHFLQCGRLAGEAQRVSEHPDVTDGRSATDISGVLDALDAAAGLNASGRVADAVDIWRGISRSTAASPELRLAIATQLKRVGYITQHAEICITLAADPGVPVGVRLAVVSELPAEAQPLGLWSLAGGIEERHVLDTSDSERRVLCALLEEMIESGNRAALLAAATDAELPGIARAAIAHALGRVDRDAGAASLTALVAPENSIPTRIVALEGLRHLLPASRWIDVAGEVAATAGAESDFRAALLDMVLLKVRIATGLHTADKGSIPWFDLGLLASYSELNNRAMGFVNAGRDEEALDALRRGKRIFPEDARFHVNLSGLFVRLKRYVEAIGEATKSLELDSHYEKALNFRAYARIELEQYEFALADLNRALELKPGDYANLRNRAGCYEALGRIEDAEADAREADRLESELGEDALAGLETSAHRTAAGEEETIADGVVARARELLAHSGLLDRAIAWVNGFAGNAALSVDFREAAVVGLGRLRAENELLLLQRSRQTDSRLRIHAAAALWQLDPVAARKRWFGNKYKEALQYLTDVVTNPAEPPSIRYEAVHHLISGFEPQEVENLARTIPDLGAGREGMLPGVGVALVLIKSLGAKEEFVRLEALARDRKANGWLRELASQTLGAYLDRRKARELSMAHLAEKPADRALVGSIERAVATYDAGERFSQDPLIEEAFRSFMALASVDELPVLNRRYVFLTDPEFIGQLEKYIALRPDLQNDKMLAAKVAGLKTLPPNPEQVALREFVRANSPDEMRKAAQKVPLLTQPDFHRWLEQVIRDTASKDEQPAFLRRLEWLRAIPEDHWQTALDDVFNARSHEQVKALAEKYPFIRSERFLSVVESARVVGAPPGHVEQCLEWLRELGESEADVLRDAMAEALKDGRPEEARQVLEQLEAADPESASGMLAGEVFLENHEFQRAVDCFTRVIERHPVAIAYERRGKALFSMRRPADAIADFTKALEESPENGQALLGRGLAFRAVGNWEASVADLEKALRLAGDKPDQLVALSLALGYAQRGDVGRAREILQNFQHWSEDFAEQVRDLLGRLDAIADTTDPVRTAIDALARTSNDPDVERVIREHPIFWDHEIQARIEQALRELPDERTRRGLQERYDFVLQIVRNPAQLAFEALMTAEGAAAIQAAIERHDILRNPAFLNHLQESLRSMTGPLADRLKSQLALLARALRR